MAAKRFSHPAFVCIAAALAASGALASALAAPAKDLTGEARRLAAENLKKMGKAYVARIDMHRHIVYVSALDAEHFRRTQELLAAFMDAQRKTLFTTPLSWNLVVLLPTVEDFKKLASDHNCKDSLGFYLGGRRKLVSVDRGTVLIHEFTHALHYADLSAARQRHPIWIMEGLATLFEHSRITPSGLVPLVDARVFAAQRALRKKKLIPLDRLFRMGRRPFMQDASLHYAQARYVMLYLYRRGRLKSWYADYKKTYTDDPTGRKALERALGNRLHLVERDWKEWLGKLRAPLGTRRKGQGRLGLEVKDSPRGVKVVGFTPGSAAKTAGRIRIGDVIVKINGIKTANMAAFVAAVRSAGAKRTVKMELIRHGRGKTVLQPLGAPKDPPKSTPPKQRSKNTAQ